MNGQGVVHSLAGDKAVVSIPTRPECGGCASSNHCGFSDTHSHEILALNGIGAQVGDAVTIETRAWQVIVSSLLIWILPITAMIIGYAVARSFSTGAIPIVMSFLFLAGSFGVLKIIDARFAAGRTFYPMITRRIDSADAYDIEECPNT